MNVSMCVASGGWPFELDVHSLCNCSSWLFTSPIFTNPTISPECLSCTRSSWSWPHQIPGRQSSGSLEWYRSWLLGITDDQPQLEIQLLPWWSGCSPSVFSQMATLRGWMSGVHDRHMVTATSNWGTILSSLGATALALHPSLSSSLVAVPRRVGGMSWVGSCFVSLLFSHS